jgi:outer membrane protein OmpA-like peptidoglycan-associated protein
MHQPLLQPLSPLIVYSPFGVALEGRSWSVGSGYRYGFQAQEGELEISTGTICFSFRVDDTRIGRFFTLDPMLYRFPELSPYAFSGNRVIDAKELLGLQPRRATRRIHVRTSRNFTGTSFLSRLLGIDYQGKYLRNNVRLKNNDPASIAEENSPEVRELFEPIPYKTGTLEIRRDEGIKRSTSMIHVPKPTTEVEKDNEDDPNDHDNSGNARPNSPVPPIDIRFVGDDDSFIDRDEAIRQITKLAEYMKDNPDANITIIGNTGGDPRIPVGHGSATLKSATGNTAEFPTTRDLMLGRARAVRKLLIKEFGIEPNRIWVAPGNHSKPASGRRTTVIERK